MSIAYVLFSSIGVARILSGVHFFLPKKLTTFLVVAVKERLNTPPNLTRPAKTVLKLTSALAEGCTSCPRGVHLHIFPVNYAWKNFFHRPGGCRCTHCTPWLRLCSAEQCAVEAAGWCNGNRPISTRISVGLHVTQITPVTTTRHRYINTYLVPPQQCYCVTKNTADGRAFMLLSGINVPHLLLQT